MRKILMFLILLFSLTNCSRVEADVEYNELTPEEEAVIIGKGTERPFSGKFLNNKNRGLYICKRCNEPLFWSDYKFDSSCGWPGFDDEIQNAVRSIPDPDGLRTEIVCENCGAHLGHVFTGEGFTEKNLRHCVNSVSLDFISEDKIATAIFAGGCFWGVQYHFEKVDGVYSTSVGYTGGSFDNPTYLDVLRGDTGHYEAIEIRYNPEKVDFESLAKLFFEIHDSTQTNGQGPDIGDQYLSAIFYIDSNQKKTSEKLISILKDKNIDAATELIEATIFWKAEDYHQLYYEKNNKLPYCHVYRKIF